MTTASCSAIADALTALLLPPRRPPQTHLLCSFATHKSTPLLYCRRYPSCRRRRTSSSSTRSGRSHQHAADNKEGIAAQQTPATSVSMMGLFNQASSALRGRPRGGSVDDKQIEDSEPDETSVLSVPTFFLPFSQHNAPSSRHRSFASPLCNAFQCIFVRRLGLILRVMIGTSRRAP